MFGLSVLIFTLTRVIPGDPVRLALGPAATESQVQMARAEMGLNDPVHVQYIDWIVGVFTGDWGMSLRTNHNVFNDILVRLPATVELVGVALIIAILIAIPFGVIAGTHQNRFQDQISRLTALFGVSMPRFWVAILLQVVFVAWLGLLPLTSRLSDGITAPPPVTRFYLVDSLLAGQWNTFLDALAHIIMPATSLALATIAVVMRLIRSEMIEQESKDYILAARAQGLPNNLIEYKYMLKNAFNSSLTIIGLQVGFLIGNAFLVETVFVWPGMARYGVEAILFQDFNAIVGVTLVTGFVYVGANLVVDLLYGYLDPRVIQRGN
jgi:peptide/nickel transport system permease protein